MKVPALVAVLAAGWLVAACAAEAGQERAALATGARVYRGSCAACHGPAGEGRPGVGSRLRGNAFVARASDGELVAFLTAGRLASDPANTTGAAMPAMGGPGGLAEEELRTVVAHLRTLR